MAKRSRYSGPCALESIMATFAGKWKPALLYHLYQHEYLRFGELRRLIPDISQRMMTQQLRELERDGLVHRRQYDEVPPRVEYSATKLAFTLKPVFESIESWGQTHMPRIEKSREREGNRAA